MKILNETTLITPVHMLPGDELHITWSCVDEVRARMDTIIKTEQVVDCMTLVEYTPEEANALGFKNALGIISGEKQ